MKFLEGDVADEFNVHQFSNDIWGFQLEVTGYLNDHTVAPDPRRFELPGSEQFKAENTSINDSQFIEIGNRLRAGKAVRCIKDDE